MGGGLLQLVAYGAQDIYLTGNPQITFFKVVYRRHTNFSIESIENTYNGTVGFGKQIEVLIQRNGDLVGNITLETDVGLNLDNMFLNESDTVGDYKISTKTYDYDGWLLCDGRLVSKFTYPRLFDKLGYSFGGSGEFYRIPDFRNKVPGFTNSSTAGSNGATGNVFEVFYNTAVNIGSDTITVASNTDKWLTGMPVTFSSVGGTIPTPLVLATTYYVIRINATTIRLATSLANTVQYTATNNTSLNITGIGSGTMTMTYSLSSRSLGESSGEESHGLTIAELAQHNHGVAAGDQISTNNLTSINGGHTHGINDPGHSHTLPLTSQGFADIGPDDDVTQGSGYNTGSSTTGISIVSDGSHNHTINPAGGNTAHNNMQPTLFGGSMFIYAGVELSDSVCQCYLKDQLIRWGFQLIDYIEVEIGGQVIDKHYGEWFDIWTQLTYTREKYEELLTMVNTSIFSSTPDSNYDKTARLYIPLQFWFNRNPGLYLPLIALQYHEVKLNINFNSLSVVNTATQKTSNVVSIDGFNYTNGTYSITNYIESIVNLRVFCDYVFLDTDERRRFAQTSHEYLIEQVQTMNEYSTNNHSLVNIPLYFNHPCKTMIWRGRKTNYTFQDDPTGPAYNDKYFLSQLFDYTALGGNSQENGLVYKLNPDIVKTAKLQMNGMDRMKERDGSYFRITQSNYYTSAPAGANAFYHNAFKQYGGGFYVYNFALQMDQHQPSGTCNFSRIDNANLVLSLNPYASDAEDANEIYQYNIRVFAVNYNVLRVMSGMAGLSYSN